MTAPFTDCFWTEVHLRVLSALIRREVNLALPDQLTWEDCYARVERRLDELKFGELMVFLRAAGAAMTKRNMTYSKWNEAACRRAREGHTFRRVAFDAYKGTRRGDPRVTNRGVTIVAADIAVEVSISVARPGEAPHEH